MNTNHVECGRSTPGSDLVAVLVELRNEITPLIEDLLCEAPPSVERWLAFVEVISSVIPLCRQQALSTDAVHGRTGDRAP